MPQTAPASLARLAAKKVAIRALEAGAEKIRAAAEKTAENGKGAVGSGLRRRLPIQRSVDVAVPVRVAWEEWMAFTFLPEGVDRVEEIEREDNVLTGCCTVGPWKRDWSADILDEREQQSFAWQSLEGSDCAGLVTFHELGRRLTRIELGLDVQPTSVVEALALSTHFADRRAEADLRRFKARLELINPDVYDEGETDVSDEGESEQDEQEEARNGN
jgi:uncharacterized membrane protein